MGQVDVAILFFYDKKINIHHLFSTTSPSPCHVEAENSKFTFDSLLSIISLQHRSLHRHHAF